MSSSLAPISNRLARSTNEKRFAGVCGGIAEYWQIDPMIVRIVFVALAFGGGISVVLYPILWMIMPTAVTSAAYFNQSNVQSVAAVQPGPDAKFDPMTGRPVNVQTPRFDPYTGQPLPFETAVPINNIGTVAPVTHPGGSLSAVERRRRILNVGLIGLAGVMLINVVANLSAFMVPALLIIGGVMLTRRVM